MLTILVLASDRKLYVRQVPSYSPTFLLQSRHQIDKVRQGTPSQTSPCHNVMKLSASFDSIACEAKSHWPKGAISGLIHQSSTRETAYSTLLFVGALVNISSTPSRRLRYDFTLPNPLFSISRVYVIERT